MFKQRLFVNDVGVNDINEGGSDECKFAVWSRRSSLPDGKIILKVIIPRFPEVGGGTLPFFRHDKNNNILVESLILFSDAKSKSNTNKIIYQQR